MSKFNHQDVMRVIQGIEQSYPGDVDADLLAFGLADAILRTFLGNDWINENVYEMHPEVSKINRQGREFLKTEDDSPEQHFRHQERVIKLAEMIFFLQNVPGIKHLIDNIRQNGTLASTYSELEVGLYLYRAQRSFRFIEPSGKRGSDYDIEIHLSDERIICGEVKTKFETTTITENSLSNALNQARRQLPNSKPGIIFVRIPEDWARVDDVSAIIKNVLQSVFRNSNRIIAVIFRWELWDFQENGSAWGSYRYRIETNESSSFLDETIANFILHLKNLIPSEATSFHAMVSAPRIILSNESKG